MKNIVFVEGNIVAKSGVHIAKDIMSWAGNNWRELAEEIVDGDLYLTKERTLDTYKIYCASKEISSYNIESLDAILGPEDVEDIYRQEINSLEKLISQEVSSNLTNILNRQIFIGVVGALELFLCDFMYCMVLGNPKYLKRYCENSQSTFKLKEISDKKWSIRDAVIKSILETNYHQIASIKKMYSKVLGVNLTSTANLESLIKTRHQLVHRNGLTKPLGYIIVDYEKIKELIKEANKIVDQIIQKQKYEIEKWFP